MKYICETLFKLKKLLEVSLNLNDTNLRKILTNLVSDMDKATEEVDCLNNKARLYGIDIPITRDFFGESDFIIGDMIEIIGIDPREHQEIIPNCNIDIF